MDEAVCVVLLDLSEAFDCADRDILLKSIEWYDIRLNIFLLLKSYLAERSQFMSFSEYQLNYENIDVVVPQDSVLGALLFLIFINDLQNITSLEYLSIADDTLFSTPLKKHIYAGQ